MNVLKCIKWPLVILVFLAACTEEIIEPTPDQQQRIRTDNFAHARVAGSFYEDFEGGTKTAYAAENISLSTGSWYLSDALIGTSSSDRKTGSKSVRVRNTGIISMNFDLTTGASTVNVKHAKYGSDGNSSWELWKSTNGGSSFTKVGSTITTSSTSLTNVSFTVNVSGTISFEIRKTSGGSNRINIDEFEVVPYSITPPPGPDNDNMLFGNPSGATTSTVNENNYLMVKTYYALSYNRSRATANWVSWYVGPTSLGSTPRQDDFRADTSLPAGWYQVGSTSYSGSGFDRGHNCPSADRTSTVAANSSTFLMTNMIPQAPTNNQQTWANLENYTRTLVNSGYETYVIMGSYGAGGKGSKGTANTIDNGRITVPNRIWKVIVVIPQGTDDVNRVTTATRVIAINTPNTNSLSSSWGSYRTSVDAIEAATGYDILSALPDAVEAGLESKVDNGPTN
ncbi:MAG: DNA/RNA non-specific endonuclease [Flammeovirgaceae bacterium]|nr:DNA/RNA non-specific endonuclease [Flammeovirgaceae bacterium]